MKNSCIAKGKGRLYGIAGGGKLATHLARYLALLQLRCRLWPGVRTGVSPRAAMADCDVVVLAISDCAIVPFIKKHFKGDRRLLHCSGALHTPLAPSAHPLGVFGEKLYSLKTYRSIPFITEAGGPTLSELLPDLPNPSYSVPVASKPLYHALCCAGANFPSLLWEEYFSRMEKDFGIPRRAAASLARTAALNACAGGGLTGPLARGDRETVARHLRALRGDRMGPLYRAFVDFHAALEDS